jgi:hypothetical protein
LNLWHALRRECVGAWRSVRYDVHTHRATKLRGAFTEEFEPGRPRVPAQSRLIPVSGVALLLAGGTAGAFLAISGGLAALDTGTPPPDRPATVAAGPEPVVSQAPGRTPTPVTPHRAGARREPVPSTSAVPVAPEPITERSPAPTNSGEEQSSEPASPSPSASASEADGDLPDTEVPRSRAPRPRR